MQPETPQERLARQQRNLLLRFGGMGLELAGGIVGFVLIGYLIDWKFNTGPVWLVVCASAGCIGGLYNLIRRAITMQREMDGLSTRAAAPKPAESAEPDPESAEREQALDDERTV